jgi:hypothetical protein
VLAIIAAVVVALFVVLALIGGGEHGPGRHSMGLDDPARHTTPMQLSS